MALRIGNRGLPKGFSSLPKLLFQRRGVRHKGILPRLTKRRILECADAHKKRTGTWPMVNSGAVRDAPGETWWAFGQALARGRRGLPGGSSLAQLLADERGIRNLAALPPISPRLVLRWARDFKKRTGGWPLRSSGAIPNSAGETWARINSAFVVGSRGLSEYGSLAQFLQGECGVLNRRQPSQLTTKFILE
jgi:hypothetical protein